MAAKAPKSYFSETEAARTLGLSVEQFRLLLKRHIVDHDEDLANVSLTTFHASDLLLLKLLSGGLLQPTALH